MSSNNELVEVFAPAVFPDEQGECDIVLGRDPEPVPLKRVHLDDFSSPITLSGVQSDSYLRRFATLFIDDSRVHEGSTSEILHAVNAFGEHIALKARKPSSLSFDQESEESFECEFEAHRALSGIKGYPRLYGKARLDGRPTIVMEWIRGESLALVGARLAADDEGRVPPLVVARLGRDLFDVLARTNALERKVVHGDLSLRNIMLVTQHQSVEEQAQGGAFDVRLIDLSSSRVESDRGSGGLLYSFAGGATQQFAAPELREDAEGTANEDARAPLSQAADVYAAASILCLLVYGSIWDASNVDAFKTIHDEANDIGAVLRREPEVAVAVKHSSDELVPCPTSQEVVWALSQVDEPLSELLRSCLAVDPRKRPTSEEMRNALDSFCSSYAANIGRALRGEQLEPCKAAFIHSGAGALSLKARNLVRAVGKGVSIGLCIAVVVTTALIFHLGDASAVLWGIDMNGPSTEALVALFAAPAILGLLARGPRTHSMSGLAWGSVGLLMGAAALGVVAALADFSPQSMKLLYCWAAFAVVVMSWCPFVLDCAFPPLSAKVRKGRRALPQTVLAEQGGGGHAEG